MLSAVVVATLLSLGLCSGAPLPNPQWEGFNTCPGQTSNFFENCANVTSYQDWANSDKNPATVNFWLGRTSQNSGPTPVATIWYIGETCLENYVSRAGEWGNLLETYGYYVVEVHVRGSGFTWPTLDCGAANSDSYGMPTVYCAGNITKDVPIETFSYFQIANDLNFAISKLGTAQNIVVADGFGTLIAQRMQNLFPNAANGYVLGGLTQQANYDFFSSLTGYQPAMEQVLSYCVDQPLCAAQAGGGQDLRLVLQNVMAAAADGSLPCNKALNWGVPSYAAAYANIFAMLLSNSADVFSATDGNTIAFIPAVLYRLQRCNAASDVPVLTTLYRQLNISAAPQQITPLDGCSVFPAQKFTYLFNEMTTQAPPPLATILAQASSLLVYPPFSFMQAVYPLYATWPKYAVPAGQLVLGGSGVQTLLLAGDVDVVMPYPQAQAAYLSVTQKGGNYKFFRMPAVASKPLATNGAACVLAAIRAVQNASNPAYNCPGAAPLDLMGQASGTGRLQYFGTDNTWAFTTVQPPILPSGQTPQPAPSSTPAPPGTPSPPGNSDDGDLKKAKDTAAAFIVLWILTLLGAIGFYCYNKRKSGSSYDGRGDFYTNLNRAT
jgi:pimeloyl-ACP methyl ester carboxylesterase